MAGAEDNLTRFFAMAETNRVANRAKFPQWYDKLSRIDGCLVLAGQNLLNSTPVMLCVLLLRAQYALKTAIGNALAGQAVEAFVMARSAFEYAAYGLAIFDDPSLEEIFINRHISVADMDRMKTRFRISELKAVIKRYDGALADTFDTLYQRAIDFGGHPNPYGTFSSMYLDQGEDRTEIVTWAMTADEKVMQHTLKSMAQVGLGVLYIFQHAFKAKFELLGIRAQIDQLRNEGGL